MSNVHNKSIFQTTFSDYDANDSVLGNRLPSPTLFIAFVKANCKPFQLIINIPSD